MALYYLLILTPFCDRLLYAYLGLNARMAHSILNWFGQDTHVSELTIRSARFAIAVRRGCDAIEPSWFFCAALLSFPASSRQKAVGILAGTALFQALNLIRIVSLYFVGIFYPKFFGTAHVEVWPAVFILVAILLWLGWIRWAQRPVKVRLNGVA